MRHWTRGIVVAIALAATPGTGAAQTDAGEPTATPLSRVRASHPAIVASIVRAREQSSTFRRMVETIDASNGLVYIQPGVCKNGVRACLVKVTSAGGNRPLFVRVDILGAEDRLMVSIGHELRHAIEVLSNPRVTDAATMYFFYKSNSDRFGPFTPFETVAAIEAGQAVADEIRRFQRRNDAEPPRAAASLVDAIRKH